MGSPSALRRPNGYRVKRRACGTCKPNKKGWTPHFSDREKLIRKGG